MSEIKLSIQDHYLNTFLEFLRTLNYVSVQEVADQKQNGAAPAASDVLLQQLAPGDPLKEAIRPLRRGVTAQDLIIEQGYVGTNWKRLDQVAHEMNIQEPIEDLLAQLNH